MVGVSVVVSLILWQVKGEERFYVRSEDHCGGACIRVHAWMRACYVTCKSHFQTLALMVPQ